MRSLRTTRTTLLLAALLAVGVAAAPVPPPTPASDVAGVTPPRSDSMNVYIVAQIGVTRAMVADSATAVAHAQYAAGAVMHGLALAQIPVMRVGWFVQAFRSDSAIAPTSNPRNPFDSWRRASASIVSGRDNSVPSSRDIVLSFHAFVPIVAGVTRYASR